MELSEAFLGLIWGNGGKGVLLVEGASPQARLELEIVDPYGEPILSKRLSLDVSPVEEMFNRVNLRGGPAVVTPGTALPPSNGKHVVFLHGLRVDPSMARAWWSEGFKKLWQSGSNARFHGVTWLSDDGFPINGIDIMDQGAFKYHVNVCHAFDAAPHVRNYVNGLSGQKVVMAHSLGNMVVSSAVAGHGMGVQKYFMLNAAVASEAFDSGLWSDNPDMSNVMVHEAWRDYTSVCWSARYHEFFAGITGDARGKLTWKDRFANMLAQTTVYNMFSAAQNGPPTAADGDEVFELYNGTPSSVTWGTPSDPGRYSWHLQETHKGRFGLLPDPAATSWAGWGFGNPSHEVWEPDPSSGQMQMHIQYYYPDAAAAKAAPPEQLRDIPVFRTVPSAMFSSAIDIAARNEILAKGIPALSPAAGKTAIAPDNIVNFNMNAAFKPDNGAWGRDDSHMHKKRWLHNDMQNMAYFYTHKLFKTLVEEGGLE